MVKVVKKANIPPPPPPKPKWDGDKEWPNIERHIKSLRIKIAEKPERQRRIVELLMVE